MMIGDPLKVQENRAMAAGKQMLLAQSAFNREYFALNALVQPCDEETGLRLLDLFRGQIQKFVFDLKRGDSGVEQAANEMFRLVLTGEADYTFQDLYGFVKWYGNLRKKIERKIGNLFEFHGDSFGDLCDSLPLVKGILSVNFHEEEEIKLQVKQNLGEGWWKFICGENYVESSLARMAKKWFAINMLRSEELFPTPEEQKAVSYAQID